MIFIWLNPLSILEKQKIITIDKLQLDYFDKNIVMHQIELFNKN